MIVDSQFSVLAGWPGATKRETRESLFDLSSQVTTTMAEGNKEEKEKVKGGKALTDVEAPAAAAAAAPKAQEPKMTGSPLDTAEWDLVLGRMIRYHCNVGEELKQLVIQIKKEMKEELVPAAEEKANYGKLVKQGIRNMWNLEYEIEDIQKEFAKSIGNIDLKNLTDDFVEDVMLQSKPLQSVLWAIRKRQKETMELVKKDYSVALEGLEPMVVSRPPKPVPVPAEPEKKAEEAPKEEEAAVPAVAAEPLPAEPAPATVDQTAPAAVEASA